MVVVRVRATPLSDDDGPRLADEVLAAVAGATDHGSEPGATAPHDGSEPGATAPHDGSEPDATAPHDDGEDAVRRDGAA